MQIGIRSQVNKLSDSPQRIPQYIEVPPNIEAKRTISYFSAVLSYSSNPLLLKDESNSLIFSICWQAICYYIDDPDHLTQKRVLIIF